MCPVFCHLAAKGGAGVAAPKCAQAGADLWGRSAILCPTRMVPAARGGGSTGLGRAILATGLVVWGYRIDAAQRVFTQNAGLDFANLGLAIVGLPDDCFLL